MKLSGREKATIFLSLLGSETSAAILRYLPQDLADLIASSINHLPTPTPEALGEIFNDFQSYVALPSSMKDKIVKQESPVPSYEDTIKDLPTKEKFYSLNSKKIAFLLSDERPQIAAFMLSTMPPMQKEEVLMNMAQNRDQVDELLNNIKPTQFSEKIKDKLLEHFAEKL